MSDIKPIKILSVDDEVDMSDLIQQKFRRKIRKKEMEFHFANDGTQALEVLKNHDDIDFLLCDINMPGMDGLTLLSEIKKLDKPSLQVVMVTAYGDMENLRAAMNNGAYDFVNKPINFDDLEITMAKTLEHVRNIRSSMTERDALVAIQQDLEVARQIQMSLVPTVFPPFPERTEIEIYASMLAAKTVGGDLYDYFFIDDNRLGFVIGDVAGKGVPGAIFMALSRAIIRTSALGGGTVEDCMFESNNLLCNESIDSMFVTVFYGILDVSTGKFSYCNAGHTLPYLVSPSGEVSIIEKTGDLVLGIMEDMPYHSKEITLEKGSAVYLFTDGVNEAMDNNDNPYSEARIESKLAELSSASAEDICKEVEKDVVEFVDGCEQSDDITMVAFRYNG